MHLICKKKKKIENKSRKSFVIFISEFRTYCICFKKS